jgi:hypothetical protein
MAELKRIKRPSPSLIKLVEACGILLELRKNEKKSAYKAPLPSNYDNTLDLLEAEGFPDMVCRLAAMRSFDVSNEVATEFYSKTLEPGFSYEDAVNTGGLSARDLFNAIALVLASLQTDESRIPVTSNNIYVLHTGSRSSYAALDAATHVFKHGVMTVSGCIIEDSLPERECAMLKEHLPRDLLRRIKMLYKMPDHCFNLESALIRAVEDAPHNIVASMEANACRTLVMGLEEDAAFGEGGDGGLPLWAATSLPEQCALLLVKGRSKVRPFTLISAPRTFCLLIDRPDLVNQRFLSTLFYVRPGDTLEVLYVASSSDPQGDCRAEDRFGLGARSGWVKHVSAPCEEAKHDPVNVANAPGWNDADVELLVQQVQSLMRAAHISGDVHVERELPGRTAAQSLCAFASVHDADLVVMPKEFNLEAVVETVQEAACSVLLI